MLSERAHQPRIAIVGAGPAGLAAAFYLKELGYSDVLVLERMGRAGGLCKSITDGYQVFDLGANYLTAAYEEVHRFAKMVGAETYLAKEYLVGRRVEKDGRKAMDYQSVMDFVRTNPDGSKISRLKLLWGFFKFRRLRRKVAHLVDAPTFAEVDTEPDLCVSFKDWLEKNHLEYLERLFHIPLPMMGYGLLEEIAAPYALKFLHPKTFRIALTSSIPGLREISGTRRFKLGFQRMWEAFSWKLNVRTEVGIESIERAETADGSGLEPFRPIKIKLHYPDRDYYKTHKSSETHCFDRLILACPLNDEVLEVLKKDDDPDGGGAEGGNGSIPESTDDDEPKGDFKLPIDLREEEQELFMCDIETFNYCQTTCHAVKDQLDDKGREVPFMLKAPVVPIAPFEKATIGRPWAAVQVWEDESRLIQFYTRAKKPAEEEESPESSPRQRSGGRPVDKTVRDAVLQEVEELLEHMHAGMSGDIAKDPRLKRWRTFHSWPYFGHVKPDRFASGFFRELEDLQGRYATYYAGGVTTFEMVEAVVQSAKHVVAKLDADLEKNWDEDKWGPRPTPP